MSNNHLIEKNLQKTEYILLELIENKKWDRIIDLIKIEYFDLHFKDKKGRSILFWAINQDNTKAIKELLDLNINTNNIGFNLTALTYTSCKQNIQALYYLLDKGILIDEKDINNSTALIHSTINNKIESIEFLVKNGANIHHKDNFGNSALILARKLGLEHLVKFFEEKI